MQTILEQRNNRLEISEAEIQAMFPAELTREDFQAMWYENAVHYCNNSVPGTGRLSRNLLELCGVYSTIVEYDRMGRRNKVVNPDLTTVISEYTTKGELKKTYGSRTYPVVYEYEKGRVKTMTTWQNFASDTGAAKTTWNYSSNRGFLLNKRYNDDKGPSYIYSNGGRLMKRTWQRGVSISYFYTKAGELQKTDYSDSTPDITFTINRQGLPGKTVDAAGTRVYAYNTASQLTEESITAGIFTGTKFKPAYDGLLRRTALNYTVNGVTRTVGYSFDAASRLKTISSQGHSFTYQYTPNSNLVSSVTSNNGLANTLVTNNAFDKLNRLTSVSSGVHSHGYIYNNANQRTKVTQKGGEYWVYTYDNLGQVKTGIKYSAGGTPVPGFSFDYSADDIGNRTAETANAIPKTFTPNLLNQYTAIGPKTLTYDLDGNLLSDGIWTYTWNGENRLVSMTRTASQKLEFFYDSMGRRFSKKVYSWSGTAWVLSKETRFIYDGWNLLAELSSTNAIAKSFTWGLDLSGSEQGAGGVGGLLAMRIESSGLSYYYGYDGNGNVSALVNSGTGSVQMAYEYSPFGQVLVGGSDMVNPFKFSTKYQDAETGLNYYGYRYYSADMGRWLNRDPIEEQGGMNVYGFVGNDGVNEVDYLGRLKFIPKNISIKAAQVKVISDYVNGFMFHKVDDTIGGLVHLIADYANYVKAVKMKYNLTGSQTCIFERINIKALDKLHDYLVDDKYWILSHEFIYVSFTSTPGGLSTNAGAYYPFGNRLELNNKGLAPHSSKWKTLIFHELSHEVWPDGPIAGHWDFTPLGVRQLYAELIVKDIGQMESLIDLSFKDFIRKKITETDVNHVQAGGTGE